MKKQRGTAGLKKIMTVLLCAALVALLMKLCCEARMAASNKFRKVCRGESLIFEYCKKFCY